MGRDAGKWVELLGYGGTYQDMGEVSRYAEWYRGMLSGIKVWGIYKEKFARDMKK